VLEDGPAHMVVESPNATLCTVGATAYRRKQMVNARTKVRVCAHARVVGVAFWDRPHNVTGRAPKRSSSIRSSTSRLFRASGSSQRCRSASPRVVCRDVARHIDMVRIQVGDELIELPWKTPQKVRGFLIGAGIHSIAKKFADKGTRPRSC
jgi:hypothetical protein